MGNDIDLGRREHRDLLDGRLRGQLVTNIFRKMEKDKSVGI